MHIQKWNLYNYTTIFQRNRHSVLSIWWAGVSTIMCHMYLPPSSLTFQHSILYLSVSWEVFSAHMLFQKDEKVTWCWDYGQDGSECPNQNGWDDHFVCGEELSVTMQQAHSLHQLPSSFVLNCPVKLSAGLTVSVAFIFWHAVKKSISKFLCNPSKMSSWFFTDYCWNFFQWGISMQWLPF